MMPEELPVLNAEQTAFLTAVESLNSRFNTIQLGASRQPLRHNFWSISEIRNARQIQQDWDVPASLIPFYGDWHDLICLDHKTSKITLLDDLRKVLGEWKSPSDFMNALMNETSPLGETDGIIEAESWLDF